jgi:regulatory protein
MKKEKDYTLEEALVKLSSYCAYQERAEMEVWEKMSEYTLSQISKECVIDLLKEEGFLNESRFVRAYAGGKFRTKKWGKLKIRKGLKQKKISDKLIEIALRQIDIDEYYTTLRELLEKKITTLSELLSPFEIKKKLFNYATSKGYEMSLVLEVSEEIIKEKIQKQ